MKLLILLNFSFSQIQTYIFHEKQFIYNKPFSVAGDCDIVDVLIEID